MEHYSDYGKSENGGKTLSMSYLLSVCGLELLAKSRAAPCMVNALIAVNRLEERKSWQANGGSHPAIASLC